MGIIIILLVILFVFGGGWAGHRVYGENYAYAGPGFGLGTLLVILLLVWLLGGFGPHHSLGF